MWGQIGHSENGDALRASCIAPSRQRTGSLYPSRSQSHRSLKRKRNRIPASAFVKQTEFSRSAQAVHLHKYLVPSVGGTDAHQFFQITFIRVSDSRKDVAPNVCV